ncbi:hypothetical protein SESBI_43872 [Sesbania bispinosa]|nr:hypothetical protein SESBI_43872 [Sesbania bispinosa]
MVNLLDKAMKQCDKEALSYLEALLYSIWWSRNKLVFEGKDFPILQSIQIAVDQATQFREVCLMDRSPIVPVTSCAAPQWSPPLADCYKLNTDMAMIDNENWSDAAIIRDH